MYMEKKRLVARASSFFQKMSWCSLCLEKNTPAVAHCPNCEKCFCEKHLDQHARRKATSTHHVVIHIESSADNDGSVVLFFARCSVHQAMRIAGVVEATRTSSNHL